MTSKEAWENIGGIVILLGLIFLFGPLVWWLLGHVWAAWIEIGCDLGLWYDEICVNHVCDVLECSRLGR